MLETKAFATKRAYVMSERKLMRLIYPTIAMAYATRNARYKSSKNSRSRTPKFIGRVRDTAAGGDRLNSYKGSKISNSSEPDAMDGVGDNNAGGAGLDSAVRPPAITDPTPTRRRPLPPNYKSTARKLV